MNEGAMSIELAPDGGYIAAGTTQSGNGDITGFHGGDDYWVVKLDASGNLQWQKALGGSRSDICNRIVVTQDGDYVLVGYSNSIDGDITSHHGSADVTDFWIVKLNSSGNIIWEKSLGGSSFDEGRNIITTSDGGLIVIGATYSNDGDVSGRIGSGDIWVVKLNSSGAIQWQKCYGGTDTEMGNSIAQTNDGGYIFTGHTYSNNVQVSGNHGSFPSFDTWVVKINSIGAIEWQKCYGGSQRDYPHSIYATNDDGYFISGNTTSNDGDIIGNHSPEPFSDYWVIKLNSIGLIQWQKCFGGSNYDFGLGSFLTPDGGYILSGYTFSSNGDVTDFRGSTDMWLVKLNSSGAMEWQKTYGGIGAEDAFSIKTTSDGGYIAAGGSDLIGGDVTTNQGNKNFWVVKFRNAPCIPTIDITSPSNVLCSGSSLTFNSVITNGGTAPIYQWMINSNPTGSNSSSFTTSTLNNSDTIRCIQTSSAACASPVKDTSNPIIVTVSPIVTPTITISTPSISICSGDPVIFSSIITNGGSTPTYRWMQNGITVGTNFNSFTSSSLNSNDIISCELTSNANCATDPDVVSNQVQLIVNPSPIGNIFPASASICTGDSILLTVSGGISYQWFLNNSPIPGAISETFMAKQPGTYTVAISNTFCTKQAQNSGVIIPLIIEQGIKYPMIRVAENKPYQLQSRTIGSTYQWIPATGLNNPAISNPVLTTDRDMTYLVNISSPSLCTTVDTVSIQVFSKPGVYIPTGFTPNGDGRNDLLVPVGVHLREIKYFKIFNRWGELVFNTQKQSEGWNGYYKGKLQPAGLYVWLFEGTDSDGKIIIERGSSMLIL